jgi:hypothetical protein
MDIRGVIMRKIIQTGITFTGDIEGKVPGMPLFLIHALCDDGTMWTSDLFSNGETKWTKIDTSDVTNG